MSCRSVDQHLHTCLCAAHVTFCAKCHTCLYQGPFNFLCEMSHVFMSRPVSSSVLKWHECVNVTRVYHACHVLCKVSRLFVYARVMFCTNATRVYAIARFMFGAKCHASLCQCHVLYRMSPVFMPLSCSVQNVTRVYARVMFCGKCHTCLCHWPCHVMCKMPHLIMQLAVSCFVQNATRDYTIGRVMLCARCHT